jgi:Dyp-type peroxidase family
VIRDIQEGIYYDKMSKFTNFGNHSYAILFLRVLGDMHASEVGRSLRKLWNIYKLLKNGKLTDLHESVVPNGGLSVLIGYGPEIFKIRGIKKKIPRDFKDSQFLPAKSNKPILKGSGISYVNGGGENVGTSQHIVIQFISETQLASRRAIVETSEYLSALYNGNSCLRLTKIYTGFQRDDMRSWLGFHDGLSNMRSTKERKDAICIDRQYNQLIPDDFWTIGGTYMSFLRIEIDLKFWRKLKRKDQEIIVGRDKLTGKPLLGVDKYGNPLTSGKWRKTNPVTKYNRLYHDHPDYFKIPKASNVLKRLDIPSSMASLTQSHIGRTRHIANINTRDPTSRRIYRQNFEFVDFHSNERKPVKVGMNFVSFQNDPRRLIFILNDPRWLGQSNFGGSSSSMNLLSVQASGMFFIPPVEREFPGYNLF